MKIAEEIIRQLTGSAMSDGFSCETDTRGCIHVSAYVLEAAIAKNLDPVRDALSDQCKYMNSIGHEPSESAYEALAMLGEEAK